MKEGSMHLLFFGHKLGSVGLVIAAWTVNITCGRPGLLGVTQSYSHRCVHGVNPPPDTFPVDEAVIGSQAVFLGFIGHHSRAYLLHPFHT